MGKRWYCKSRIENLNPEKMKTQDDHFWEISKLEQVAFAAKPLLKMSDINSRASQWQTLIAVDCFLTSILAVGNFNKLLKNLLFFLEQKGKNNLANLVENILIAANSKEFSLMPVFPLKEVINNFQKDFSKSKADSLLPLGKQTVFKIQIEEHLTPLARMVVSLERGLNLTNPSVN